MSEKSSILMTVGQMIDKALGPYDANTVDFKLIHTILHILAKQLRLLERRVQVRLGRHYFTDITTPPLTPISVTELKLIAATTRKKKSNESVVSRISKREIGISEKGKRLEKGKSTGSGMTLREGVSKSKTKRVTESKHSTLSLDCGLDETDKAKSVQSGTHSGEIDKQKSREAALSKPPSKIQSETLQILQDVKEIADEMLSEHQSLRQIEDGADKEGIEVTSSVTSIKQTSDTEVLTSILERIEEERERVLRVIHQRADSLEEPEVEPQPMASAVAISSLDKDIQQEKILVVERIPSGQSRLSKSVPSMSQREHAGRLSVVTKAEFEKLQNEVRALSMRLRNIGNAEFLDNEELMLELRKGASLTDAMAALQLAARMEAAEKALKRMTELMAEIASSMPSGIKGAGMGLTDTSGRGGTNALLGTSTGAGATFAMGQIGITTDIGPGAGAGTGARVGVGAKAGKGAGAGATSAIDQVGMARDTGGITGSAGLTSKSGVAGLAGKGLPGQSTVPGIGLGGSSDIMTKLGQGGATIQSGGASGAIEHGFGIGPSKGGAVSTALLPTGAESMALTLPVMSGKPGDYITAQELMDAVAAIQGEFSSNINGLSKKLTAVANNAMTITRNLEDKIESLNVSAQMQDVELIINSYFERITKLDTEYSAQLTDFQEKLTQMQFDLEVGLDNMMETLASTSGDPAAVAELNNKFTALQFDFDSIITAQKDLHLLENRLGFDLQSLQVQVEIVKDIKCDREEVEDALKDKAGIGALNGLVSLQQFDSVRGDFEKKIGESYDKFNSQEIIWQKAIDDLGKELNEKADIVQVVAFRDDVHNNFQKLFAKVNTLSKIVGEPRAAAVSKRLFRDTACISCSTAAKMNFENQDTIPQLPAFPGKRPPVPGAEAEVDTSPKDDGDHGICYVGKPVPHEIDPRAHICRRYCGGSHTLLHKKGAMPPDIIIKPFREGGIANSDKVEKIQKPCIPCNTRKSGDTADHRGYVSEEMASFQRSDATPNCFIPNFPQTGIDYSETPPLQDN